MTCKKRYIVIVMLVFCLISQKAFAKTYAWLTDYAQKAYKLDVNNMKIVRSITITQSLLPSAVVQHVDTVSDTAGNALFVIYDYPGIGAGQGVRVMNLKDLSLKKDLAIVSQDPNLVLPKIVMPPSGNKFYLVWWDRSKEINGVGGETYGIYEKNTANKLGEMTSFPVDLNQPRTFSTDGSKLYVINMDANEIRIYDCSTLGLLEIVSISNIWGSPLYKKRVVRPDGNFSMGDRILFEENIKNTASDPNNFKYFVYNASSKSITNKISIPEVSKKYLSPDGSKIIANEIRYTRKGASISGTKHINRVCIYNVSTGQKLKTLDLSSTYSGLDVSAISSDSAKLFLVGVNVQTNATTTIIVDLTTYNIVAQFPVEASFEVFFEDQ